MSEQQGQPQIADLEWYTLRELALRWRTSKETLRKQCESGYLKAMKVGAQWRIHESVVAAHESAAYAEKTAAVCEAVRKVRKYATSGVDHIE